MKPVAFVYIFTGLLYLFMLGGCSSSEIIMDGEWHEYHAGGNLLMRECQYRPILDEQERVYAWTLDCPALENK